MYRRRQIGVTAAVCIALTVGVIVAQTRPDTSSGKAPVASANKERDADREAILKSGDAFSQAFEKGDAKAIAALWTDEGECHEIGGNVIQGRAAIEKAYAELFKDKAQGTIEVDVRSIRFPSRDTAIEEGFLRHTPSGPGLPSSTMYTASHVREDGKWLIAYSREYGGGQDRLGDLAFLIGKWEGRAKGQEISLSFERDGTAAFIIGKFTKKADGKVVGSGSIKIGLDAQRGQIRSWHFDDDGGHGQCLWVRDDDRWALDAMGATADGTETDAVNILSRLNNDELTWRSIDRVVGGESLPDTAPIKLIRVGGKK